MKTSLPKRLKAARPDIRLSDAFTDSVMEQASERPPKRMWLGRRLLQLAPTVALVALLVGAVVVRSGSESERASTELGTGEQSQQANMLPTDQQQPIVGVGGLPQDPVDMTVAREQARAEIAALLAEIESDVATLDESDLSDDVLIDL